MDEPMLETLKLANKAVDQTNSLNKHIMSCITIILCVGFVVFGICTMYNTYNQYDYNFTSTNVNDNKNTNENGGK